MELFYLRFHLFLFLTSRWLISCFISNQGGRGLCRVLLQGEHTHLFVCVFKYEYMLAAKMSSIPIMKVNWNLSRDRV